MVKAMNERCCQQVPSKGTMRYHRCERRGTTDYEGRAYCRQHNPTNVAAKRAKRDAEYSAADRRRQARNQYEKDCVAFVERIALKSNSEVIDVGREVERIFKRGPQ